MIVVFYNFEMIKIVDVATSGLDNLILFHLNISYSIRMMIIKIFLIYIVD